MKKLKFTTRLLLVILSISLVSISAVYIVSFVELRGLAEYSQDINSDLGSYASTVSRQALIEQLESYLPRVAQTQAHEIDKLLDRIMSVAEMLSIYFELAYVNPGIFREKQQFWAWEYGEALKDNDTEIMPHRRRADNFYTYDIKVFDGAEITGETEDEIILLDSLAYLFYEYLIDYMMNSIYMGTETGITLVYPDNEYIDSAYDPRERPWYKAAADNDYPYPVWTDVYIDAFSEGLCTTCVINIFDENGDKAGVIGIDITLDVLTESLVGLKLGETGYAFLLNNRTGNYLTHPGHDAININAVDNAQGEYKEILESMMANESGVNKADIGGVAYYIAYTPLVGADWSVGIVVEYNEIISGALAMEANIESEADVAREQMQKRLTNTIFIFIVLLAVIIAALAIVSVLVSNSVTKPVIKLTNGVIEAGKGNLSIMIDIDTEDEIGVLAASFNQMTNDLKEYITNLSKVTAEKERIGAELDVATKIQASMLPCIFPAFPDRDEFDIYASMIPAKEIGGDFYDYFMIDENTLAIVVADVSGKGIPAALFMVITKTLIKNNAQSGKSPKEVFETVNNILCENNDAEMFVTAFMGYFDIPSGRLTFVNAGHNPPLIKNGGKFDWLKNKAGFVLAGMEDIFYKQHEIYLNQGDELFFYTDGVTEAVNNEQELFGEPRLLETMNNYIDLPLKELIVSTKREIDRFADGAEQADDITMIIMRIAGGSK